MQALGVIKALLRRSRPLDQSFTAKRMSRQSVQGCRDAAALEGLLDACLDPQGHQNALLARLLQQADGAAAAELSLQGAGNGAGAAAGAVASALDQLPLTTYGDYQPAIEAALAAAAAGNAEELQRRLDRMCGQPVTSECARVGHRDRLQFPTAASSQPPACVIYLSDAGFWVTSGTTGKSKVLPVTAAVQQEHEKAR